MGTTITPTESNLLELEDGTYPARLVSIVHQGTTIGRFGPQTQAIFTFVFPTLKTETARYAPNTKVFVKVSNSHKSQFFNVLKKLGIDTTKPFDLEDAIGKECQVTVVVKDGYLNANRKDIAPLVKGLKVPECEATSQFFWFTADYKSELLVDEKGEPILNDDGEEQYPKVSCSNVTMTGFDCLTEKQVDKIVQSWEYNWLQKNGASTPDETEADSMPF